LSVSWLIWAIYQGAQVFGQPYVGGSVDNWWYATRCHGRKPAYTNIQFHSAEFAIEDRHRPTTAPPRSTLISVRVDKYHAAGWGWSVIIE
jgi:hypothetical protein